jgi:hypothetical protein
MKLESASPTMDQEIFRAARSLSPTSQAQYNRLSTNRGGILHGHR